MATSKSENTVQLHGITFPSYLDVKDIQDTVSYVPKEGDIILTAYPNTGEEWLQHVVLKLLSFNAQRAGPDVTFKIVPVLERAGAKMADSLYDPRIYKHHLPYHMVKKNELAKCIYIYRNPEDTLAAHYYHQCRIHDKKVNLETVFQKFWSGRNMEYGRYFEHARSYFRYQKSENLLLVSFEKLHYDHRAEVLKIAKFLDKEYFEYMMARKPLLDQILSKTEYENIPHHGALLHDSAVTKRFKLGDKVNEPEAIVGGGKKLLSADQIKKLHDTAAEVLKTLNFLTQPVVPESSSETKPETRSAAAASTSAK